MSFKIAGIGEVLWDLLPTGPRLGGAPANFACHVQSLGGQAAMITRVGRDPLGKSVCERFAERGLATDAVQIDPELPTGTVTVTLDDHGEPRFVIHENAAWDGLELNLPALSAASAADAVCFGTLAQRTEAARAVIQQLIAATPERALRVFDVNLRQAFYTPAVIEQSLQLANVLKLNESELAILARVFSLDASTWRQMEQLAQIFGLRLVALTRGARGSVLFLNGRWSEWPHLAVSVADTVGAGDAFTAALVLGLLQDMDLDDLHATAAECAGYVCTQVGATPELPAYLRKRFG